jgi:hypothetical protein
MSKPKLPRHFLNFISSYDEKSGVPREELTHLAKLIENVWQRLPPYDRAVLRKLVSEIFPKSAASSHVLGSTGAIDPQGGDKGNAGDIAKEIPYYIHLKLLKGNYSDDARMFIIAHELAHVVLRHHQLSLVAKTLLRVEGQPYYTDEDVDRLYELNEEDADLQVWVWGFGQEMRHFLKEFPESRKPRWFVDLTPSEHP